MQSWPYLAASTLKFLTGRGRRCPSCGGRESSAVDRKWLVTAMCRCSACGLLFRTPTTSVGENERIYQNTYREDFTTELPTDDQLAALLRSGFAGHEKDYSNYLSVLKSLGVPAGAHLFDFGCSWGYGSHQLAQAGYQVEAYEISRPRGDYAHEKLGVTLRDPADVPPGSCDVFFSAHVIEHVPSVGAMIATGLRLLRPGGLFVAFTPNQSEARRRREPARWHRQWGFVHPQLLDDVFLGRLPHPHLLGTSSPYDWAALRGWAGNGRLITAMSGDELLLVIRKET